MIGKYDGTADGLKAAVEHLRARAGQHYAGNNDDLARSMREAAAIVEKEAVKAAQEAKQRKARED